MMNYNGCVSMLEAGGTCFIVIPFRLAGRQIRRKVQEEDEAIACRSGSSPERPTYQVGVTEVLQLRIIVVIINRIKRTKRGIGRR